MQSNVSHILSVAAQLDSLKKITSRHFRELTDEEIPVLLIMRQELHINKIATTSNSSYDGEWTYPTVIYCDAQPHDEQAADYTKVQAIMGDFLSRLLGDGEYFIEKLKYYEATLSSRELVAGEVDIRKFVTQRFIQ